MEELELFGKPAIRINATEVTRTDNAVLLDCEGDEEWFPLSTAQVEDGGTALIQEWKYNAVFNS